MTYNSDRDTNKKGGQSAQILDIPIFGNNKEGVLKVVEGWVEERSSKNGPRLVFTPNAEILVEASRDAKFKEVLKRADINIADGAGVVLAAKITHQNISVSLPGTDLAHDLVMMAAQRGWKVFYLGGRPGVAEKAAKMLEVEAKESGDKVSPNFAWEAGRPEDGEVTEKINAFGPDILLVALGQKKQETWLVENQAGLKAKVAMGIGGAFDFWSGRVKRAPSWVNRAGFEWLYRLIQEPWRWRRQLRLVEFMRLVLKEKFK